MLAVFTASAKNFYDVGMIQGCNEFPWVVTRGARIRRGGGMVEQFDRHHASGGGIHGGMDGSGGTAFDQSAQLQSADVQRGARVRQWGLGGQSGCPDVGWPGRCNVP